MDDGQLFANGIPIMTSVLVIVWLHFFADFLLQNDRMAIKKSSSDLWLTIHLCAYTWPFFIVFGWRYALFNGAVHWMTDWVTSRATTRHTSPARS